MPIYKMNRKKDGLQGYRVIVSYTDSLGNHKKLERKVYGKSEAQEAEQKLLSEIKTGENTTKITVSALFDEYMLAKKHDVRETTYDKTKRILQYAVIPALGSIRLDNLTVPVLQKWKDDIGSNDLKLSTKQSQYKELSAMLNFAVKRGYLVKNPLSMIGNFKDVYFEKPQDVLHYYTPAEYTAFARAARAHAEEINTIQEWSFYVFFALAFFTGARKGEIIALKWSDIDGNILHIRRSISQKLKGEDRETPPKNKSSYRDLQIPKPLAEILAEHKQRQQSDPRFSDDFRICGGAVCLRDTTVESRNQFFAKEAGLPHIRIHDFRHSHASLLCNEGINIQEVARRLGHSKVEQTWNTYAHLYPREEERAVSILNKITL